MKRSHPSRVISALIVLISLLFMQLAVAGYACPILNTAPLDEPVSMSMDSGQAMTGCETKDTSQPSLCRVHDQANNQSLDKPVTPLVAPFLPAALTLVFRNIEIADNSTVNLPNILLTRSTAPPLSIRNCCFRI